MSKKKKRKAKRALKFAIRTMVALGTLLTGIAEIIKALK